MGLIKGSWRLPVIQVRNQTMSERYYQQMSSQRMGTTQAAPGRHPSRGEMRTLNLGAAAARAVCSGRMTSMVVPGSSRRWLPKARAGTKVRLSFNGKRRGGAIIELTGACFHARLDEIPGCERRHDPNAIDGEDTWEQILNKALWGKVASVEPEVAARRAALGWYVLDFTVRWRHEAWCAAMGIAAPRAA